MEARFVKCIMNCCGFAGGVTEGYLNSCLVLDYQKKVEKAIDIYQLIVYNISKKDYQLIACRHREVVGF